MNEEWPKGSECWGRTVYECPQHDYCDGGCGYVYTAQVGEAA